MFDPITLGVTAGATLLNFLGGQQQRKQAARAEALQKAMFDEQMRFAKSGRTDAYGNRVYYDNATGEWKIALDPYQDRIIKAGEREQLLGLTKDAAQNRNVRDRAFARGQQAEDDFARARAGLLYSDQPSEGAAEDRLARLMALSIPSTNTNQVDTSLRTRGAFPVVKSGSATGTGGDITNLAQILMNARKGAVSEVNQRSNAINSRYAPRMQMFEKTAGGGGGAPIHFSDMPDKLNKEVSEGNKAIQSAYASGARSIGTAMNKVTDVATKGYPSVSDASKLALAFKGEAAKDSKAKIEDEDAYGSAGYYGGSPETNWRLNPYSYYGYGD